MAQHKRKTASTDPDAKITDYRHADKRKNIPPAGLAAQGHVKEVPKTRYAYDPHLPPVLRFDDQGQADALPEDEEELIAEMLHSVAAASFLPEEYGLRR